MTVTREDIIRKLADQTGFYQKDIRTLLYALDDAVEEILGEAKDNDEVVIQFVRGIKISNTIMPERSRINPQNRAPIICAPTAKPKAIFSETLRKNLQKKYEKGE